MSTEDDDFLTQLRATFRIEAAEHLQAIASGLVELEQAPQPEAQSAIVETVFRAAHSLKGAARAVDFMDIESLCQSLEDVFAGWKRQESTPSPSAFDALHRTLDAIGIAMSARKLASGPPTPAARPSFELSGQHSRRLPAAPADVVPPAVPSTEEKAFTSGDSVRVSIARLNARLVDAEEMLAVKLTFDQRVGDLGELARRLEAWRREWAAVEPHVRALHQQISRLPDGAGQSSGAPLPRVLDFLDWNQEQLRLMEGKLAGLRRTAQNDRHTVGKLVDDLLEDSKRLLLLPFDTISAAFPKLVRDLCRDQGKEADFKIQGEHTEIDKRILEEMKDPLIHLLRNCVDHGIETAAERVRRGKPARATITLAVAQFSGNKVRLTVSDDGTGIDADRVKAAALSKGHVSAEEAAGLAESEALALIFRSGLSTSAAVTQLSGRGLGLAIVWEKVNKLGGSVSVDSKPGEGTIFRIDLPATRSTFRGLLVEAAGRVLVVPTARVERVARVAPDAVRSVEGRETISFDGRAVALVWLADVLELPPDERQRGAFAGVPVFILGRGEQRIAFAVDEVLDEQEILVKPLTKPLSRVRNVSAATVLGSGQVAPILNVADLLKSARKLSGAVTRGAQGLVPTPRDRRSILVAEDSITSRMLIKGMLESAGYHVKTAADGMEAFTLLRTAEFDLVVSDVEMPRLDGFELTRRIRADCKLAELPVVLVTALESREDRERGIDVGANAYLVKSSFDQSNLIEAVRRLT